MAQCSVALVIGLLCVLVSVALKINVFPETPRADESEKELRLDTASLHDMPLARLHAPATTHCVPRWTFVRRTAFALLLESRCASSASVLSTAAVGKAFRS